jgi:sugar phosphate isomerase/epimerase
MSYIRCFSTLGCPELGLEEIFALAARHGIAAIELRALAGSIDLAHVLAGEFGTPERLAEIVRQRPQRIVALDASLRLINGKAEDREQLAALAPWAEALGVRWLRVFDGGSKADDAELADAKATVAWWRELRARNGWRADIMVETHDSLFTAAAIQRFAAVAPGTAILWDSHHTWKRGGEDPVVTWQAVKALVVHIHVKDSVNRPSEGHAYTYALPGAGEFPMAALRVYLEKEFTGCVSLEWEKLWRPSLAPLEDALSAAERNAWW